MRTAAEDSGAGTRGPTIAHGPETSLSRASEAGAAGCGPATAFDRIVRHLAEALGMRHAFVLELLPGTGRARMASAWTAGRPGESLDLDLAGTAAERLLEEGASLHRRGAKELFAGDGLLRRFAAESCCGASILAAAGEPLGFVVAVDDRPLEKDEGEVRAVLSVFAGWAGAEFERLRAERAGAESDERASHLFRESPVALAVVSVPGGRFLDANDAFARLSGYRRDEVVGRTGLELGLWRRPEELAEASEALARDGRVADREYEFRTRDGRPLVGRFSGTLLSSGGAGQALVAVLDVTSLRRLELHLRTRLALARLLSETPSLEAGGRELLRLVCEELGVAGAGIWTAPREGERLELTVAWSASADDSERVESGGAGVAGRGLEGLAARVRSSAVPSWSEESRAFGVPLLVDGRVAGVLATWSAPDGALEAPDADQDALVLDVAGQIGAYLRARRLAEKEARLRDQLIAASREWRRTFDAIDTPTMIVDGSGRVARLNKSALELAGRGSYEEVLWREIVDFGPAEPWTRANELVSAALRTRGAASAQVRERSAGRTWELTASYSPEGDGEGERVIVVLRDVTVRLELEESLRRSERTSALGTLIAGVAHEVRNPLYSISLNLEVLEAEIAAGRPHEETARIIRAEVERLSLLTKDLLNYGCPPAMRISPGSVASVLAEARRVSAPLAAKQCILFDWAVEEDLPAVAMDWGRLVQALQNVLQNALEHAPGASTVAVTARALGGGARRFVDCVIEDEGPGFPPGEIQRVFEPFFTRRRGGTGLGLAITRRNVEEHGGSVTAENREGGGARVVVRLPAAPPAAAAHEESE